MTEINPAALAASLKLYREADHWRLDIGDGTVLIVPIDVAERMAHRILDVHEAPNDAAMAAMAVSKGIDP